MDPSELMQEARDALTVKRVFGEPFERNGITVIPAASIRGGAGGGRGERGDADNGEREAGTGGGFGLSAKPAGAYLIKGDDVHWQPAVDLNRIILGGQLVGIVFLLVLRSILKHRR